MKKEKIMAAATDTTTNPVVKLIQSSKFLIVLVVCILTFVGVFKGAMTWKDANDFLRWIIGPWLVAQGMVDVADKLSPAPAAGRSQSVSIPSTDVSSAALPATDKPPAAGADKPTAAGADVSSAVLPAADKPTAAGADVSSAVLPAADKPPAAGADKSPAAGADKPPAAGASSI